MNQYIFECLKSSFFISHAFISFSFKEMFHKIEKTYSQKAKKMNIRKRPLFECIICLNVFTRNIPCHTPHCSHFSCRDCLRNYFNHYLNGFVSGTFEMVPCPYPNCKNQFYTEDELKHLFTPAQSKRWWKSAHNKAFITNKVRRKNKLKMPSFIKQIVIIGDMPS